MTITYVIVEEQEGHPQFAYSRCIAHSEYSNAEDALHYLEVLEKTFPNENYHVRVIEKPDE